MIIFRIYETLPLDIYIINTKGEYIWYELVGDGVESNGEVSYPLIADYDLKLPLPSKFKVKDSYSIDVETINSNRNILMTFHYCIDRDGDPCFWYLGMEGYYTLCYYSNGWEYTDAKRVEAFGRITNTKSIDFPTVREMINFMERTYPEYLL